MSEKDPNVAEMKDGGLFVDPSNYRKMAEPFASVDLASAAINAFWNELYDLRNKHRIRDVHVILECEAIRSDGNEGTTILSGHIGDGNKAELMVGYAFGQVQAERQDRVSNAMSGKSIKKLLPRK